MNIEKYRGVFPAFYACYGTDGEIDLCAVRAFTRHLIDKKVKGLYVGGSSGECIYQHVKEREKLLEAVMEEARGKLTIIAHVGCNNTRESMQLAAHAESLGVDAIASIPPIYFHLPEYAIAQYWNDISSAAPNTDFVIYNIPQLAGVALTESLFREMLKNPSMPTQDIDTFVRLGGERCVVFNGPDEQFVSGRAIGAAGGIGGTYGAMPELFLKMDGLIRESRYAEAAPIQHEVNEIISELCACRGNMYAVIKAVLKINEGLSLGSVRKPLIGLQPGDEPKVEIAAKHIREAIAKYC